MKRALFIILLMCTLNSYSQVGTIALGFLADKTVKDGIKHFEDIASSFNASNSNLVDMTIARLFSEMNILLGNLDIAFQKKYDRLIRDLNEQEQNFFIHLIEIENQIKNATQTLNDLDEFAQIILIDLTNRLKFITRKVDFYISSISGLVIYQNDLPVNLTIRGLGFGYIPNDDYLMEIFIEGKKIPSDLFQIQKDYELSVSIPQEIISPFYDNDSLKYINGSIKITKREKLLKPRKEYNINIKLTILPKIAGFLEFEEIIIDQIFGPETSYDLVKNVSGSSTKSPNDWSQQWGNAPTNSTITRVTYECAGRGCGWCYNPNGGYKVNYSLSMNNTMVTVRRHCDGKSCIVTHNIFYITKVDTTYTLSHSKILLEFNKQYTIKLDKKNTNHHYKLTGKTFLNQPIYMDNSSFSRPVGPITGTGQGNYGDNFEISILTKGVRDFITQ